MKINFFKKVPKLSYGKEFFKKLLTYVLKSFGIFEAFFPDTFYFFSATAILYNCTLFLIIFDNIIVTSSSHLVLPAEAI